MNGCLVGFVGRRLQQRQPQLPAAFAIQLSKSLL